MVIELPRHFLNIVIPTLIGTIVLFLSTPPRSYILYLFWVLLVVAVVVSATGRHPRLILKIPSRGRTIIPLFLICSAILLLISVLSDTIAQIRPFLYVVVILLAPGLSILQIMRYEARSSLFETLSLSFTISVVLLMIVGTALFLMPVTSRNLSVFGIVLFLCLLSYALNWRRNKGLPCNKFELSLGSDSLVIGIVLLIFGYFIADLYPALGNVLGWDLSRMFLTALAYSKYPPGGIYYLSLLYPLFSVYESYIITLVGPLPPSSHPVDAFHLTSILVNFLIIIAFYVMANAYLKNYGRYVPAVATAMWTMFSGFGWLSFIAERTVTQNESMLSLISNADVISYGDITWRRLFFHLPMELSLGIAFSLLYLLKRDDMPRFKLTLLMVFLLIPLPLIHPGVMPLLYGFLLCFALFAKNQMKKPLKSFGYSLVVAPLGTMLVAYVLGVYTGGTFKPLLEYIPLGLAILVLTRIRMPIRLSSKINVKASMKSIGVALTLFVLTMYLAAILLWFSGNLPFEYGSLDIFGYIPWFLYPMRLGILGVLYFPSIYIILTNEHYKSRELLAVAVSVPLLLFGGRLISIINTNYASEFLYNPHNYMFASLQSILSLMREDRMLEILRIPLAIVGSLVLSKVALVKMRRPRSPSNPWIVYVMVSLIFISGMSSVFLGFEYYHNATQTNVASSKVLSVIETLRDRIYQNGSGVIIADPQIPGEYLDYTGAVAIYQESPAAWRSNSPEFPLFVTRVSKLVPTYIFVNKTLDSQMTMDRKEAYLQHLSDTAPVYLSNEELAIKQINNWSIPVNESSTALVIPYDASTKAAMPPKTWYQSDKQFMVLGLFFEDSMRSLNFYKEGPSGTNVKLNGTAIFNGVNSSIRLDDENTNFDKILVELKFQPLDLTHNQVIISKFDWGTPPRKSWEIAQYGKKIAFKISPDGNKEEVLLTDEILSPNVQYVLRAEYDGYFMKIFVNDRNVASKPYDKGVSKTNTNIVIGAELMNNVTTSFANMMLWHVQVLDGIPPSTESIFYAYDILSSSGFNYTTMVSNDNGIENHDVLVLPYDDLTCYDIFNQVVNSQTARVRSVVVLNTNGYGPFLSHFGRMTTGIFSASGIATSKYLGMLPSVKVPAIESTGADVKARYVANSNSSPFIMATTINRVSLIYVNIYPLISINQVFNKAAVECIIEVLSDRIKPFDATTLSPWFTLEPSLLFTRLNATGTIKLVSGSIQLTNLPEDNMLGEQTDKLHDSLARMDNISVGEARVIQVTSDEVTVEKGYGFYTTVVAHDPSIVLTDRTSHMNGKDETAGELSSVNMTGNVTLLMRQPDVSVNGKIRLESFYFMHGAPPIYSDGRDITLDGNLTLHIYLSDEATIAFPYSIPSPIKVRYDSPRMKFDETASFILMIPYALLVTVMFTSLFLLSRYVGYSDENIYERRSRRPAALSNGA